MSQSNNNEQTSGINKGSGLQYGEYNSKPTLLPYHEYMAIQRQNNSGLQSSSPSAGMNANQGRSYSQHYYSGNRGSYTNGYYNAPQNVSGYTLPPYSQYQRENYGQYYNYHPQQHQHQQSYNYYYNNKSQHPQTSNQQPNTYCQSQSHLTMNQYSNNYPTTQSNNIPSTTTTPLIQPPSLSISSKKVQQQQNLTKHNHQEPLKISQTNTRLVNNICPEKQQHIYKQQQSSNNSNSNFNNSMSIKQSSYENQNKSTHQQQSATRYQQDQYNSSNDQWSEQQEQQQIIYQRYQNRKNNYHSQNKNKTIHKKKDPILDDPQQIKKWIQARKKNYPTLKKKALQQSNNNQQQQASQIPINKSEKQQMSKLEYKIRKKLLIVNGDSRSIMKKIKNIDILRRIIQDPKVLKRERKSKLYQNNTQKNTSNKQQQQQNATIVVEQTKIIPQEEVQAEITEQVRVKQTHNESSSQSQDSIEPEQAPANKVPRQQEQEELQEKQGQTIEQQKKLQQQPKQFFEYINKKQPHLPYPKQTLQQQKKDTAKGALDPETIIAHLKSKQQEDRESLNTLFDYKSNSHSYNYRVQTLQTSLKLDQIFAQTTYLLQAIRYIVKENFFDRL